MSETWVRSLCQHLYLYVPSGGFIRYLVKLGDRGEAVRAVVGQVVYAFMAGDLGMEFQFGDKQNLECWAAGILKDPELYLRGKAL